MLKQLQVSRIEFRDGTIDNIHPPPPSLIIHSTLAYLIAISHHHPIRRQLYTRGTRPIIIGLESSNLYLRRVMDISVHPPPAIPYLSLNTSILNCNFLASSNSLSTLYPTKPPISSTPNKQIATMKQQGPARYPRYKNPLPPIYPNITGKMQSICRIADKSQSTSTG